MIDVLFETFAFFLLGYISRKSAILPENADFVLVKFIINISFPSLVLFNIYNLTFSKDLIFIIIVGWVVILFSIGFSFLLGKLLKFNKKTLASFIMMSTFSNTSFLGFPLIKAFLGEENIKYAVVFDQLVAFLSVSILAPFIVAFGKNQKARPNIKNIIMFPPFIALCLGFMLSNFKIPSYIEQFLYELGMLTLPLALFSIGWSLKLSNLKNRIRDVSLVLFIKMLYIPLILILVLYLLDINFTMPIKVAILEISMPPMVLASIFIINGKLDKDLAVSSVGAGIVVSFFTVFFIKQIITNL